MALQSSPPSEGGKKAVKTEEQTNRQNTLIIMTVTVMFILEIVTKVQKAAIQATLMRTSMADFSNLTPYLSSIDIVQDEV